MAQHRDERTIPQIRKSESFLAFDSIEWLKKRVPKKRLIDDTVKLKYLLHPIERHEHDSVKKVFDRFDDGGNSISS